MTKKKKKKQRKQRAGKGAIGEILTRFISPKVRMPDDKRHRSRIILIDRYDENGKWRYSFHFEDGDETELFNASYRYVTILKEGDVSLLFDKDEKVNSNNNEFEEPDISWKKSLARKLLYNDVMEGRVPLEGTATEDVSSIYMMHLEYSYYNFDSFKCRLNSIQKSIKKMEERAADDQIAFNTYVNNNPVSLFSYQGYIQWQGSEAQKQVQKDLANGVLESYTKEKYKHPKMAYWLTQIFFYWEFPLPVFRDKIRQEIRKAKYVHTLKVRGKNDTYKYAS